MEQEKHLSNPTPPIETTKEVKPTAKSKKPLYIALAIFFLFVVLGAIAGIYYAYQNSKDKNTNTSVTSTPTSTATVTPTAALEDTFTLGSYTIVKHPITRVFNIDAFKYVTQEEADKAGILGPGNGDYDLDLDSKVEYYDVGTVKDGKYAGSTAIYGFRNVFGSTIPSLKYIIFKNTSLTLFNKNKILSGSQTYIVDVADQIYLNKDTKTDSDTSIYTYASSSDVKADTFAVRSVDTTVYKDTNSFTPSIKIGNSQTYFSKDTNDKSFYALANDGFFKKYLLQPIFYKDTTNLDITWSTGKTGENENQYDFISIGKCSFNSAFGLEVSNEDIQNLTIAGKSVNGEDLYEYKDKSKDTYAQKIYNEDYIKAKVYEYNTIKEDDKKPLTYDQFFTYHPVFYWKDPFGRFIKFVSSNFVMTGGCAKPVVYLYSPKEINVNVSLNIDGRLTASYPLYNNGWNVTVKSNGDLISNGENLDYLFWEGQFNKEISDLKKGWIIPRESANEFLQNKLSEFGFNGKEKSQFIEYWLPILQEEQGKYLYINFVDEKVLDKVAPITVSTKVDNYKRFFMLFKSENTTRDIEAPVFSKLNRDGFVMFEWGGARL